MPNAGTVYGRWPAPLEDVRMVDHRGEARTRRLEYRRRRGDGRVALGPGVGAGPTTTNIRKGGSRSLHPTTAVRTAADVTRERVFVAWAPWLFLGCTRLSFGWSGSPRGQGQERTDLVTGTRRRCGHRRADDSQQGAVRESITTRIEIREPESPTLDRASRLLAQSPSPPRPRRRGGPPERLRPGRVVVVCRL